MRGSLVEFISVPVMAGFSSAAALIIACSQVKGILGISIESENFVDNWMEIFRHIPETRPWDLTLSICCFTALLSLRKLKDLKIRSFSNVKLNDVTNRLLWLLSTSRNVLVVVICATVAYFFTLRDETPFRLTGRIDPGFPRLDFPPFSTTIGNRTYGFVEMCSHLGKGIVVVPLVSLLNNVAIAKAFASEGVFDGSQEMMTLGLCNVIASFFKSMPVSGSFSRSAVNDASGVETPLGNLYTGCLVILSLAFLTPYFFYIPKATLASVIICAVIFMVEIRLIGHVWRANRKDLIPAFATFLACLWYGVEFGILAGLAIDLMHLMYLNARPKFSVENLTGPDFQECVKIHPKSSSLLFQNIDFVRTKITQVVNGTTDLPVIIDCSHVTVMDFSAIQGLEAIIKDGKKKNRRILFYGFEEGLAEKLSKVIGEDFVHVSADLSQSSKDLFNGPKSIATIGSGLGETDIPMETWKLKSSDESEVDASKR